MPEAINYIGMLPQRPDLGTLFARGYAIGQAMKQADTEDQYKKDMFDAYQNPTPDKFVKLQLQYPDKAAGIKGAWDTLDSAQQDAIFRNGMEISNAMRTGNVDVAKQKLQTTIDANKNAGKDTSQYEHILNTLDSGNTNGAITAADLFLSSVNPKKYEDIYKARQSRAEEEKTGAEAKIKGEEAARAKEAQQAALDKAAADLGLTKAQTNKAMVETAGLGIDNKKKVLEYDALLAGGGVDPEKKAGLEDSLRKEYVTNTGDYSKVRSSYENILAAKPDAVGDMSLIFGYMKMLDPGSVVREGEYATAANTAGVPDAVRNAYNRLIDKEPLTPALRTSFKEQAKKIYEQSSKQEKRVRAGIERVADSRKLDKANIFYEEYGTSTPAPPSASSDRSAPTAQPAAVKPSAVIQAADAILAKGRKQ